MNFVTLQSMLNVLVIALFTAWSNAEENPPRATFEPSVIAVATPNSDTFALVNGTKCDSKAVATTYKIYERNSMVFQACVSDAAYQIFPFSGVPPTPEQIGNMARSRACRAILSAALLADIPECNMGGYSLRSAAETTLKITVDVANYPQNLDVIPSTDRFRKMTSWRRSVNLAESAGLPCDRNSTLYSEFASNLYTITTDGLVRLTSSMKVEYRPDVNSPFSQEQITYQPGFSLLRGAGSFSGSMDTVKSAADTESTGSSTITAITPQTLPGAADESSAMGWSKSRLSAVIATVAILALV
ncbi:hypothetical protein PF005_g26047 [Phytophthora fragariae]|uniref:Elicitin n=2 Tax=Phytophthora fragariae TaxID=53985 RepID=A0A6A3HYR4_9STRA|nr:hypothetical protein PF003_g3782 [Phytophthora fragariae]KAE8932526.1 hypothetical protein PF009_g17453 [Phytophthora fragariae]KAE8973925.1 hypothetical protein PF011_g25059 [Phytophthora fragariae]KAE9072414.1 hypothetical protein PF010_g25491 [Phytophthora fragariae]KAE9089442.1 hypothetical protein PF006_g25355 [Phytophthora fragariae]